MITMSNHNTNTLKSDDVITVLTGKPDDSSALASNDVIAPQIGIIGEHFGLLEPKLSEEPPTMSDYSNLLLHGEQDTQQLAEVVQEPPAPINLAEAEAATVVTENTADTVINDEVGVHATTDTATPLMATDVINEAMLDAVPLADVQPPTAPPSDMPTKKKRNRLSEEIREMIVQKRQDGHPELRIARDYKVSLAQVERVLYQYVATHGHSFQPTKYLIFKGGVPMKNAELLGISKKDFVRIEKGNNDDIILELFQLGQKNDSSAAPAQPKRKPTKVEQEVLDEKILSLFKEGHPSQAIALMCRVSESFVAKAFFRLVQEKKLTSFAPNYEVIKGGCPFTSIKALGITKDDFVRIERNEAEKITVTKFDVSTLQDLSID